MGGGGGRGKNSSFFSVYRTCAGFLLLVPKNRESSFSLQFRGGISFWTTFKGNLMQDQQLSLLGERGRKSEKGAKNIFFLLDA